MEDIKLLNFRINIAVTAVVFCLTCALHADAQSYLRLSTNQVLDRSQITINLQSPTNAPFIATVRVYINPSQQNVTNNIWPLGSVDGYVQVADAQDAVPMGSPFSVDVDLMNFGTGRFYFVTYSSGTNYVYDHLDILPAPEVTLADTNSGLYATDGSVLALFGQANPGPVLSNDTVYILAVNLNHYTQIMNQVMIDYYDPAGQTLLRSTLMRVKIIRGHDFSSQISLGSPTGIPVDPADYSNGMARVFFRTPRHEEYYETDGMFRFRHYGYSVANGFSFQQSFLFWTYWDDTPAAPPLPTFAEHNASNYPGESWRNDFPLDSATTRLVRFGGIGITSTSELQAVAQELSQEFSNATKGYFTMNVEAGEIFPLVNPINTTKVTNWYAGIPKTPGKQILDVDNSNDLYCATLLYYYEHAEGDFLQDMQTLYPAGSQGEDITLYLFDGPGSMAKAMGSVASRIKITQLYPAGPFSSGFGTNRTYHFDAAPYVGQIGGTTVVDYVDYLWGVVSSTQAMNSTIHELGHTFWVDRAGVSEGDHQTQKFPFNTDTIVENNAYMFFTRFEYMSYDRDRLTFDGMTYGDVYPGRLLEAYPDPIDSDNDGLPNNWEWTYFGEVTNVVADEDVDVDGLSNVQEYIAGTDPTNNSSVLAVSDSGMESGTNFVIQWYSVAGRTYALEGRSNLMAGGWNMVSNNIPATEPLNTLTVQTAMAEQNFYRIRIATD